MTAARRHQKPCQIKPPSHHPDTINTLKSTPEFLRLADDNFRCRVCREAWPAFAVEVRDSNRHPEMAHGSPSPEVLIVSINPKFDEHRGVDPDVTSFAARATSPASVLEENSFDLALAKALPKGYGIKHGNVTNTRVYKCATSGETRVKGAASRCADRFLRRELQIMNPRVVLALGKSAWPEIFRVLDAGPVPATGCGPHAGSGEVNGRRVPIVACWHLTGNMRARSDAYRFAVREMVCEAMRLAREPHAA